VVPNTSSAAIRVRQAKAQPIFRPDRIDGSAAGQGGLGWYIFQNRNELYTDKVFAGLAAVILIGLLVENVVFRPLETFTIRRWGMQR